MNSLKVIFRLKSLLLYFLVIIPIFTQANILKEFQNLQDQMEYCDYVYRLTDALLDYKNEYYSFLNNLPQAKKILSGQTPPYKSLSKNDFFIKIKKTQIFLFTDIHNELSFQKKALELFEIFSSVNLKNNYLVLEWIEKPYQNLIDSYLNGDTDFNQLKSKLINSEYWPFPKKYLYLMLKRAKQLKVKIILTENKNGIHSLRERDQNIVTEINLIKKQNNKARFFVFYGAYHIFGKSHLYHQLKDQFEILALTSVFEDLYFSLYNQGGLQNNGENKYYELESKIYYFPISSPFDRLQQEYDILRESQPCFGEELENLELDEV